MPDGVTEFLELVEDDDAVAAFVAKLPAFVVNFLDVRLGAGRCNNLVSTDFGEPLKALATHSFRKDRNRRAGEQGAVISAAATVIAR